jgi:hypothetical protein
LVVALAGQPFSRYLAEAGPASAWRSRTSPVKGRARQVRPAVVTSPALEAGYLE